MVFRSTFWSVFGKKEYLGVRGNLHKLSKRVRADVVERARERDFVRRVFVAERRKMVRKRVRRRDLWVARLGAPCLNGPASRAGSGGGRARQKQRPTQPKPTTDTMAATAATLVRLGRWNAQITHVYENVTLPPHNRRPTRASLFFGVVCLFGI